MPSEKSDVEHAAMVTVVSLAKQCVSEPGNVAPKVAAAVVRDNRLLAVAFRGEETPGEHAEFTLLRKLDGQDLRGATLITTLEPCTRRNPPKIPCADRVIEVGISKVLIGQIDPNPDISGKGVLRLRDRKIAVDFFPGELMSQLEELNLEFSRHYRLDPTDVEGLILAHGDRTLNSWHIAVNKIYWQRNSHVDLTEVFSHLVEVVAVLSGLASNKQRINLDPAAFVQKATAWWMALCGKAGISDVADLLFRKFPGVCPYCECCPHDNDLCSERKKAGGVPDWDSLQKLHRSNPRPEKPSDWLKMFRSIYPVPDELRFDQPFARLTEELGELAEAVRLFREQPNYFLSEAADVFAWLMRIENIRESSSGTNRDSFGITLDHGLARSYPDFCLDCEARPCKCPPILKRTIGRIAKEMPRIPEESHFISFAEQRALFGGS